MESRGLSHIQARTGFGNDLFLWYETCKSILPREMQIEYVFVL